MPDIRRLARQYGVADHYYDYRGDRHEVSEAVQAQVLAALNGQRAGEDAGGAARHAQLIPAVIVARETDVSVAVHLKPGELSGTASWRLALEQGWVREGEIAVGPASGAAVDPAGLIQLDMKLGGVPLGYHQLNIRTDERSMTSTLIVAPQRCYQPPAIAAGRRLWGLSIQLYSLRSRRNWGIGDFGDLRRLAAAAAPLGVDFIGLNPLHALSLVEPAQASPYSPSSRVFLNPLYIDVTAVPGFSKSKAVGKLLESNTFANELQRLRSAPHVDYPAIAETKLAVLAILYRRFRRRHVRRDTVKAQEYNAFVAAKGPPLREFALFQALGERLHGMDAAAWGWPAWPPEYRRPDSEQVRLFADGNGSRIGFFMFLQWLADRQLSAAQEAARAAGMALGLYQDLAVGSGPGGAEVWADQALFATGASIGAPPDPLALNGQDWGIPPINPHRLREQGYRGFIELMRANMAHGGALRIDHVMALMRLWWVPAGNAATDATYVDYPLEDLLAIVALESQRQHCLVVGEDLGTVPDAMRAAMAEYDLYSYRVVYFEKDGQGQFRRPEDFPAHSLITLTTHDLPSLWAYWSGLDIELRDRLGLYASDAVRDAVRRDRDWDKGALLYALQQVDLLPAGMNTDPRNYPEMSDELAAALEAYLARSRAALMSIHLEDWLAMTEPVNVPGTYLEHPNWQRKLTLEWETLLARADVIARAQAIRRARA